MTDSVEILLLIDIVDLLRLSIFVAKGVEKFLFKGNGMFSSHEYLGDETDRFLYFGKGLLPCLASWNAVARL